MHGVEVSMTPIEQVKMRDCIHRMLSDIRFFACSNPFEFVEIIVTQSDKTLVWASTVAVLYPSATTRNLACTCDARHISALPDPQMILGKSRLR